MDDFVEDGEIDLNEIDYDNPKVVAELMDSLDLEDDEFITECIDTFADREQMKAFYTALIEKAGEEDPDFQVSFNEEHFDHLQERYDELED